MSHVKQVCFLLPLRIFAKSKGLVSKETVTLHRSASEAQTFDLTTTKKDLKGDASRVNLNFANNQIHKRKAFSLTQKKEIRVTNDANTQTFTNLKSDYWDISTLFHKNKNIYNTRWATVFRCMQKGPLLNHYTFLLLQSWLDDFVCFVVVFQLKI